MAFFFSDNPIALFLALVVVVAVLKGLLSKHSWFKGGNAAYISAVLIGLIVLMLVWRSLLRMLSFGVPFMLLILLFIFGIGALFFALGMPGGTIAKTIKGSGIVRTTCYIVFFCIIALSISHVYGERLLEDQSVSIADPLMPEEEAIKVDFAPVFQPSALYMILIVIVLAFAFYFVAGSSG